jgi:retron-type reverse transcriptase
LRSKSHPNEIIDRDLYKTFILNKDLLRTAYEKLKSRPGMMTPGINPTTLDGMSEERLDNIINKLRNKSFKFTPGKRIIIPKSNGKRRPLTLGSPEDKLVQEVMRMVLEAIYEPLFLDVSHGYRPKRSCHSALRAIFTKFKGCT